ncbi:DUF3558 domain-containing protein [Kutzneria buriramensis]|uniref:Uncharacterized protein DUF3558 n=1 Tax=Kutzneria buriramensis TaxID=1045776 RepID=A0A3E0HV73_9PSEU|nr:DUF3558 domain-containing protein [Kutzneria buriramensis]REH50309.1 uncharacterized protein DUF3558 [Kutzneria buriramensis]
MRRSVLLTVVTAGVALAAGGCGGTASGSASPATNSSSATGGQATSAAPPTAKFDPCAVLPADGLSKLGISGPPKIDPDTHVCTWQAYASFIVNTHVNTYALGQRPDNGFSPTVTPMTVGSHKAELWRSDSGGACAVNIALGTGTFSVDVSAADSKGMETACTSAKELATAAEPKLPTT